MTSHVGSLTNLCVYDGVYHVLIGNGDLLRITHTGDTTIDSGPTQLILHHVLLVPDLERSLLSSGQLTTDYPVNYAFSNRDFVIKDWVTQQVLMRGIK